jgi:formylglycine-generating enzyme required for sulfatase activity
MYPDGAAVCGALDMAGNLWEWCLNDYEKLTQISLHNGESKVLRGGAFDLDHEYARTSSRNYDNPNSGHYYSGFRVVVGCPVDAI